MEKKHSEKIENENRNSMAKFITIRIGLNEELSSDEDKITDINNKIFKTLAEVGDQNRNITIEYDVSFENMTRTRVY